MILLQIKCICLMLINNNKLNNNVCMNMLSLKIHLSSLESSKQVS